MESEAIGWMVSTGMACILSGIMLFLLLRAYRSLRGKKVGDAKFFINSGIEQIVDLSLVVIGNNATLNQYLGHWEGQLEELLQEPSLTQLLTEAGQLKNTMKTGILKLSNEDRDLSTALVGFGQFLKDLKNISQEKNEATYSENLNIIMEDFQVWRDQIVKVIASKKGGRNLSDEEFIASGIVRETLDLLMVIERKDVSLYKQIGHWQAQMKDTVQKFNFAGVAKDVIAEMKGNLSITKLKNDSWDESLNSAEELLGELTELPQKANEEEYVTHWFMLLKDFQGWRDTVRDIARGISDTNVKPHTLKEVTNLPSPKAEEKGDKSAQG